MTLGKTACSLFGSPGRESFELVTLGKPLHVYCSGLPGDRAYQVDTIVLLRRWS